ncbi:MAG: TetR/AcrR family transcriptional regulator [Candidatus Delongbacteria bacterium]|jgi:AcrR family transcriptional regulator|nr:TetR/AcrR family transcriptional regulator [Candidatus Delongbacteria bacterium]MDD4205770.1 TetR/AcrR family transcriptional regulator [Candidatus Delongbacteria bacterium]
MAEDKNENTEEKIITAANDVFEKKGYDGAKMQEIADKAGINKALLHYYFRSKDKLFEMIFGLAFRKLVGELEFLFDTGIPVKEKVRIFVDRHTDFISRNRHLPLFIINEVNRRPEIFVKLLEGIYGKEDRLNKLLKQIEEETKAGILKQFDPRQIFLNMIAMNIFPFAAKPLVKGILRMDEDDFGGFIAERKKIVTEIIIKSISEK